MSLEVQTYMKEEVGGGKLMETSTGARINILYKNTVSNEPV